MQTRVVRLLVERRNNNYTERRADCTQSALRHLLALLIVGSRKAGAVNSAGLEGLRKVNSTERSRKRNMENARVTAVGAYRFASDSSTAGVVPASPTLLAIS